MQGYVEHLKTRQHRQPCCVVGCGVVWCGMPCNCPDMMPCTATACVGVRSCYGTASIVDGSIGLHRQPTPGGANIYCCINQRRSCNNKFGRGLWPTVSVCVGLAPRGWRPHAPRILWKGFAMPACSPECRSSRPFKNPLLRRTQCPLPNASQVVQSIRCMFSWRCETHPNCQRCLMNNVL